MFEYGSGKAVDPEHLRRMNQTLLHRGPDEGGEFIRPGVGLAVRRLSIIDVAEGHQPFYNEDGSVVVVFNGEIYNYLSLREELLRKGHRLHTRADTEVIPHLYEEEGPACVERLDGMFAFALYDARPSPADGPAASPSLLLARDRLGKKPLYYADVEGALIFGSELKPILQDRRVSRELDLEALHHYLSLQVVPAPYSIFKSVRKLNPGYILECDAGGITMRPYWKYLDFVGEREVPEEEAVAEIRRLLFQAVEKRLMSDVPLGAFLSGGLDSSTVVAIMSRLTNAPVKTFAIGFEGPALYNELPDARLLAQHCRTEHHEVVLQPSSVETIEEVVQYADEPFSISSAIPLLVLSRWARQHITVVLTGDGGDEAFTGYDHYAIERWLAAYRKFPVALDGLLVGSAKALGGREDALRHRVLRRTIRFVEQARRTPGQRRVFWAGAFDEAGKRSVYTDFNAAQNELRPTSDFLTERMSGKNGLDSATWINALEMLVLLPDEMLTKVDRMTMAASLEARCPLLDWRLIEYMAGLPLRLKAPGWRRGQLKRLMRLAVADLLPSHLLRKPKHGFNVPLSLWFRGGARGYLESVLSPQRLRRRGIFRPEAVTALLSRHMSGEADAYNRLFALLVFEVWAERYL